MKRPNRKPVKNIHNDPKKEALRYLENAETYLKKTTIDKEGIYVDSKYVRTAGHTALCGVYVALDPFLEKMQADKRKKVGMYRELFPKRTYGKERKYFNHIYKTFHYDMGYDGFLEELEKENAFDYAKTIIEWANQNYPKKKETINGIKKRCKKCKKSFLPERKNIVHCKKCRR